MAGVDMFLRLDGIEGESNDARHKGEIDVESFSFGAASAGSSGGGARGGAGKVSVHDFTFTTQVSKASPKLFVACVSGEHIKTAVLTIQKAGVRERDFLEITLSDVTISGYHEGVAEAADVPIDQVTMRFSRIHVSYSGQRPDSSRDTPVTAGWDVDKNTQF